MADYTEIPLDVPDSPGGSLSRALPDLSSVGGAGGGFSWGDFASGLQSGVEGFGNFAKSILPAAQLGLSGLGVYEGIQGAQQLAEQTGIARKSAKTQQQVAGQAQATAAPLAAFSQSQLDAASKGQIPAPVQAQIDLWKQGAKQKAADYAARSGMGDSQTYTTWLQWIDQQAEAMMAQALESEQSQGIQAGGTAGGILGAASGAAGGAGAVATGQQNSIEALIAGANQTLAKLTAGAA